MKHTKVLIVDDSTTNNLLCKTIFEENGYHVNISLNSKEALKSLQDDKPDIILLDLMLPGIDGFTMLDTIKNKDETKDIPVIMVSAKDDRATMRKAIDLGAIDFVKKPIGTNRLLDRVNKVLTLQPE